MKKAFVVILLSITTVSFSQEYYRDTTIERAVFNEVNRHRDSMGIHTVRFNSDNTIAVPFAKVLVQSDLDSGGTGFPSLFHCGCNAGIEIIAKCVIGNKETITKSVNEIAEQLVKLWDVSLAHKKGMEDIDMVRGFNAVYIYKSPRFDDRYVALSVYQFLRDKDYYINLDWDENKHFPNRFLSEYELANYWNSVLERIPKTLKKLYSNKIY